MGRYPWIVEAEGLTGPACELLVPLAAPGDLRLRHKVEYALKGLAC